ncbi:M13 family metallopeptidase [Limnovirga soli]|uniref:M13 family peptidase n=1 Tax=Limnovirga soli TaxID=2656915 RepID=A0A8J8FDL3_9BACT|nr:M13 family metallopeptidase [Limnovirga soli]NNV54698.1 M13 family peptidase [Limnovirga soli]
MHTKHFVLASAFFMMFSACNNTNPSQETTLKDAVIDNLDTTVNPGQDFFMYANGGWIKKNPIPNEQASWGIGNLVIEENLERLRTISEDAAKANGAQGTPDQKIGDFFTTAMDSSKIEKAGITPLQPYLDKIAAITDTKSLLSTVAQLKVIGSGTLFADFVTQDDMNSEVMTFKLWQGGIGLPEREYYFKNDSATINIRKAYVQYITNILTMSGTDAAKAAQSAKNILALETNLASASRKIEDLRDPHHNYNKIAISALSGISSVIDWTAYLQTLGVKNIDSVIVGQPEFFKALDKTLQTVSIEDWKSYLRFNLISDFAIALPDNYGIASFNFSKLFSGATVRKPRWKRVISSEENAMGELLGQLYVKEYFNETAKQRYSNLVEAIRTAMHDRIANLSWMSDSTKQRAFVKLAAVKKKVGYPDKWKDFSGLTIGKESWVANIVNANSFRYNREMNKLGKPVDRDEWDMYPQTYNAYYNPSNNEIVLPAGIFTVPGFRDEELDDAVVYGYAGASTIGHELTHGFDDEGRQFDAKGNLLSWWTKDDETTFNQRAEVMVKQFNAYEPLPQYHINGKATLGENIADLGGILLGIDAFKKTEQYKKGELMNGLNPMQRYFIGYALGWLGHERDEVLRSGLLTDVHSPAKYRVNGPFADVDEFYTTFNIKQGDAMYIADSARVRIW